NTWDVVQVESEELLIGCEEGLYEKIDWSKLGGKEKFIPSAVHECGVGAIIYNFILSYDGARIKDGPKSWADFWDVAKWPGKRALRKGPKTTLEIALMADGVKPEEVYKALATDAGVERAFKKLDQIKSNIIWWEKGAQPPQLLASGDAAMVVAYNGRISAANKADKRNFKIVWADSIYTIDSWVIMKDSPNTDAAYKSLPSVNDHQTQAKLPPLIPYGVTTASAIGMIAKEVLPELPTAPDNFKSVLQLNDKFWLEHLDKLNQRFNAWVAK